MRSFMPELFCAIATSEPKPLPLGLLNMLDGLVSTTIVFGLLTLSAGPLSGVHPGPAQLTPTRKKTTLRPSRKSFPTVCRGMSIGTALRSKP
jgi:hypothetical protein